MFMWPVGPLSTSYERTGEVFLGLAMQLGAGRWQSVWLGPATAVKECSKQRACLEGQGT